MSASPDKLKLVKELGQRAIVFGVARVPGTQRLFFGGSDFKVCELDLAADKPEPKELGVHGSYVTGVTLAGKVLVTGGYDCKLLWWDTDSKKQIRSTDAHAKWIRAVSTSPDGKIIASVADDMVCRLWDATDGKMIRELRGHKEMTPNDFPSMLYAVAWSPDGKYLATADKVGHIVVWETATGKETATMEAPVMYTWDPIQRKHSIGGIRSLAFSPDGSLLAVGGTGKIGNIDHLEAKARLELFDWRKGERTWETQSDKFAGLINRLEFIPGTDWLLGAGGAGDGYLLFFDVKNKKIGRQEKAGAHLHSFAASETHETIWAVGHNKVLVFEMKG
jgi:WD40 repeat protein